MVATCWLGYGGRSGRFNLVPVYGCRFTFFGSSLIRVLLLQLLFCRPKSRRAIDSGKSRLDDTGSVVSSYRCFFPNSHLWSDLLLYTCIFVCWYAFLQKNCWIWLVCCSLFFGSEWLVHDAWVLHQQLREQAREQHIFFTVRLGNFFMLLEATMCRVVC